MSEVVSSRAFVVGNSGLRLLAFVTSCESVLEVYIHRSVLVRTKTKSLCVYAIGSFVPLPYHDFESNIDADQPEED